MSVLTRLGNIIRNPARSLSIGGTGLEAGRFSRRMSGWLPGRIHVNTLISYSGRTTLARARYLVRNNPYAAGAVECFTANLVGDGIQPSWVLSDNSSDKKIEIQNLFDRWTRKADAENVTDFYGLMRRIGRELFIAGEIFVRIRPRFLSDNFPVPLQLQLLPSEMCPVEYTNITEGGNYIRQGIEFDKIGRRVAYWFWPANPGDSTDAFHQGQLVRVPAEQIMHIYDPVEAGQIRGLSKLTPAVVLLWTLDAYDDAELERKKTAALFSIFITRPDPSQTFINKVAEEKAKTATGDDAGVATVNVTPGSAHQLFPGEDVKFSAPADVGQQYEAFQYRTLTRFSAAIGLPYAGITGDHTKANYGSQRAALLECRRRLKALQYGVIVFQFCQPTAEKFLDSGLLAGKIKLAGYADDPSLYQNIKWIAPKWEWVDPLKDRESEVVAINARAQSISQWIEAEGGDPEEVFQTIANEQRRMKELGIEPAIPATLGGFNKTDKSPSTDTPIQDPAAADGSSADGGNSGQPNNLNGRLPARH